MAVMLTTVDRLEELTGPLEEAEEGPAVFMIELVSAHIISRTGISFELKEAVIRRQATWDGRVFLPYPTHDVSSVRLFPQGGDAYGWQWDGWTTIYNLAGWATVDIDLEYGFEEVPDDLELVTRRASFELFRREIRREPGTLADRAVGDIRERYASGELDPEQVFTEAERELIDSYRPAVYSMSVGTYAPPTAVALNWFQTGG